MLSSIRKAHSDSSEYAKGQTLEQRIASIADSGLQALEDRLIELDHEWTAGRMTKATLGVVILTGLILAELNPWWVLLPVVAGVFLLSYVFGRSSWLGIFFHRIGYRTGWEVDQEKMALKALRGDFLQLPTLHNIESQDDIARLEGEGGIALDREECKVDPLCAAKVALDAART